MKAIIMAGGEGTRLRPLTCDCPKPMVPLMDRPVMSYALELLKKHGIREAAVTLQYLPDCIQDYFGDGSESGMSLSYYVEKQPLGTAGSVRQAKEFLDSAFIVLSGDGLTDCDLSAALAFHKSCRALATLVTKRVDNPQEYGVVISGSDGRIQRFVEKPGWGEALSDTVSTGIYILEPEIFDFIPPDRPYDFGRELFPRLVEQKLPVYAYAMTGYWCDIGDLSAYMQAHIDALEGRIQLPLPVRAGGVCRMPGAKVDRSAILEGPCYIGEGAVVRAGARIGAYSVLGAGSVADSRASIKRAVLWKQAHLHEGAQARGCVLQHGAVLGENAAAFEESVLADGAVLGARSVLLPGVKVWPRKHTGDGMRLDSNLVWGSGERPAFTGGRLALRSPAQAARAAQAYSSALRPSGVLLGRSASSVALSYALSVQSGLIAQGVQVLDAGVSTLPQLRVMAHRLGTDAALFVNDDSLRPLTGDGAELRGSLRRKVEQLLLRQDYERAFTAVTKLPVPAGRSDLMYIGFLLEEADTEAMRAVRPQIAVCAPNEQLLCAAECAFEKAGCTVRAEWEDEMMELSPGETGVWLTEGGEGLLLAGEDGSLTDGEETLLRVWTMLEKGVRRIVLPVQATHAAEELAMQYGAEIIRVKGERAHYMQALIEESRQQLLMQFDGLYAALQCIGMLTRRELSLSAWQQSMPHLNRRTRSVPVDRKDAGRVLSALIRNEPDSDTTDGLSVRHGEGWAWIAPAGEHAEYRVVAEARDAETAAELCDFYAGQIEQAAHSSGGSKKGVQRANGPLPAGGT